MEINHVILWLKSFHEGVVVMQLLISGLVKLKQEYHSPEVNLANKVIYGPQNNKEQQQSPPILPRMSYYTI